MFKIANLISSVLDDVCSLIMPARCISCGELICSPEYYICLNCLKKHPKHQNNRAGYFSLLQYSGLIQKLVWHLKYDSRPEIGEYLGAFLANELKRFNLIADEKDYIIIPVPLHPKRKKKRGYNQSDYLAKGMADSFGCKFVKDFIVRNTNNISQTQLNKNERGKNVQNIFNLNANYPKDSAYLIIDDVITTGATTREILKLLKNNGYEKSIAISLAAPSIKEFENEL